MKDEIRTYLLSHSATAGIAELADDESLLEAGVLDSMSMVDLIAFIEKTYGIAIDEDDMVPENFDTIDAMAAYVGEKHNAS